MFIITRYLLRQFIGPLLVCLIAFNGIFILFDLFGHLSRFLDSGLDAVTILRYYGGVISMYSHWFMPASCMLATLYTMWNLSHHNELTAMRASGISFHKLTLPFFLVALVLSLAAFINAEFISPKISAWSENLKENDFKSAANEIFETHSYVNSSGGRQWTFRNIDVSRESSFKHAASPVDIRHETPDHVFDWGVRADSADFVDGLWWLRNPKMIHFDIDGEELPETAYKAIPLPSCMPFPELTETPQDMALAIRNWEFLSARDMLRVLRTKSDGEHEKWFDFWYALAAPWTCIVITLFAIPAGITTGRQSVFKGVALVLVTFFGFYAFTLLLEFAGHAGLLAAPIAAGLPNVVFLGIGGYMYSRLT